MKALPKIYTALIFVILYAPIAVMVLFSFNRANSTGVFAGFSLYWYRELFPGRGNADRFKKYADFSGAFFFDCDADRNSGGSGPGAAEKQIRAWGGHDRYQYPDDESGHRDRNFHDAAFCVCLHTAGTIRQFELYDCADRARHV